MALPFRSLALVATCVAFCLPVPSQDPLPRPTAGGEPTMLATPRYLFVLRGEWLFQFDVDTLELKRRVRLDAPGKPPLPVVDLAAPAPAPAPDAAPATPADDARGAMAAAAHTAVSAGLDWLQRHQDEDGRWDADGFMKHDTDGEPCDGPGNAVHDVGITGLAMLALLGTGSNLRSGPHRDSLRRAATWLRAQQQENGLFGVNSSHDFIYDHAIATYAICEAYGLSSYSPLKRVAQRGLDYLESHRNPYSVWRYQPRDNDNDSSVTTWCVLALKSGEFFGLEVNRNALKLALVWFDQVSTPDGRVGYSKAGEPSSRNPGDHAARFPVLKGEALTAAGLFCRYLLGQDPQQVPIMMVSADRLIAQPPQWDTEAGTIDEYYWFFGSHALYQVGGRHWQRWSRAMVPTLVASQRQDGNARGSWDPLGVWSETGGRVYTTALLTLSLATFHRDARLVR